MNRENNEKLWLQREAEAQEEFLRRKLEEERKIKQKEEQEVNNHVFHTLLWLENNELYKEVTLKLHPRSIIKCTYSDSKHLVEFVLLNFNE